MGKRDEALSLARDFERDGFRVPGLYERFWWLQGDETAYFALADSLLRGQRESGALLKDAMGYVGEDDFKALIATAVEILRENARSAQADKSVRQRGRDKKSACWKNAEEVIAATSLEFAPFLHQYLGELFKLQPNESAYYAEYPWRERLASAQASTDDKRMIFECLLQTRQPQNLKFACEIAAAEKFLKYKGSLSEHLDYYLEDVGFTLERIKFTGGVNGAEPADKNLSQTQGVPNDVKFNASKLNSQANENLNDCKSGKDVPSEESQVQKAQASDEMSIGSATFRLKRYCGERVYITLRLGRGILASRLPHIKLKITRLGDYGRAKRKKVKARKSRKQIWARRRIKSAGSWMRRTAMCKIRYFISLRLIRYLVTCPYDRCRA